ncbi:MAG: helix-turn-helix transcriptional regulator [Hyphomicrobium sp.]|nr:helix-turn-helix transcriptional regulator [Hyphomicrobium sp.]
MSALPVRPLSGANSPPDVGGNLRRLRNLQGHSLETLSRLSGVSRAMLGQIENGKSVPTITSLWKIAKALGMPVTALISSTDQVRSVVVPKSAVRTVSSSAGRYQQRTFERPEFPQSFKFVELKIAPGHREVLPVSTFGARATLLLTSGTIEIAVSDDPPSRLAEGTAILFQADVEHFIFNPSTIDATAFLIVSSARNGAT